MTNLTIGGETFRVTVDGEAGRPVVLLSCSLGTDLSLWDAQMPALLEHFRVVRYDPRGHGQSGLGESPVSLDRLGRDVLAILDALSIETTHFVGLSMGGAVGQWLLVNAPERIERAVLANTAARLGTPDVWNSRIATALADGMEALATATMERWFGPAFRAALPERVAAIEAVFRATSPRGYVACCAALRDMDQRENLRAIDRPVLVITGIDDPVTSAEDIALLARTIAGATHVSLDCRHISNIEAREAFDAAVIGFLTAPLAARPARRRSSTRTAPPAIARRRPAAKARARAAPAKRRAPNAEKTAAPKKAATKAAPKKAPAKKAPAKKAAPTRRATAKARLPVRKPTTKTKATKTAAKKAVVKKPTKKMPAPRRNPTKKPRRPSGRRKP